MSHLEHMFDLLGEEKEENAHRSLVQLESFDSSKLFGAGRGAQSTTGTGISFPSLFPPLGRVTLGNHDNNHT